jgi:putative GTP pyrophosphokinase
VLVNCPERLLASPNKPKPRLNPVSKQTRKPKVEAKPDSSQKENQAEVTKSSSLEDLIAAFNKHRGEIEWWLSSVRQAFESAAPKHIQKIIHSIRFRLKDEDRLLNKLQRQFDKGKIITVDNLFDQIEDLGALRIITLYRVDLPLVHEFIMKEQFWKILGKPDIYAWQPDDIAHYRKLGIEPTIKKVPYTSNHYIVGPASSTSGPKIRCEIQVRSIHLEGWGEVDHQLLYPDQEPGPVAREVLRVLHEAVTVADVLAHIAREAANYHEAHTSELSAARQLELNYKENESKFKKELQEAKNKIGELESQVDSEKRKRIAAEAKQHLDSADTLFSSSSSYKPMTTSAIGLHSGSAIPSYNSSTAWSGASVLGSGITCERCKSNNIISYETCSRCKRNLCNYCFESRENRFPVAGIINFSSVSFEKICVDCKNKT